MRSIKGVFYALCVLLVPAAAWAGQIYGTIVSNGQPLKDTKIDIQCGTEAAVSGTTGADGAYRINVGPQGQCTLKLPGVDGAPSAVIFSTPNPSLYNFQLVKLADGKFELQRR